MDSVTVSSDYQIVVPEDIRRLLGIEPGQQLQAVAFEGRLELIPIRPIQEYRGMLEGMDTHIEDEDDQA